MPFLVLKDELEKGDYITISGFPGVANVAKIAVDYLIDKLETEKVAEFYSDSLPAFATINENNELEPRKIELYKVKDKNLLLLTGNAQPVSSQGTNVVSRKLLRYLSKKGTKKIIAFSGIGLNVEPDDPKVYVAATDPKEAEEISKKVKVVEVRLKAYESVSMIFGLAGTLPALAPMYKMKGISLMAETLASPWYLGVLGAYKLILVVNELFNLNLDMKEIEEEVKKIKEAKEEALKKMKSAFTETAKRDVLRYFG